MDYNTFKRRITINGGGTQRNVFEIKKYLETLHGNIANLQINQRGIRFTERDWDEKENIVMKTKHCAKLLLEIFDETNGGELLQYGEWYEVYCLTFTIGKHICEIVCKLCVHVAVRLSWKPNNICASIAMLPQALTEVLESLKHITTKVWSNNAKCFKAETPERMNSLLKTCTDFNIFVCQDTKRALRIMKLSKSRSEDEFKPLLASVVKHFHYLEKGCGLTRLILKQEPISNRDRENQSLAKELKKMFKHATSLLINGRSALRSLSFKDEHTVDVNGVYDEIRNLKQILESGTKDWNYLLEEIENTSSKICIFVDLGDECLPEGHQQIEDVKVIFSSNSVDDTSENGSDFDGVPEDDKDDGNIKRIPVKEIEHLLPSSDVDKSEILHVFKMEDFETPVTICVDNHSEFNMSKVRGTVFKERHWISATNVEIEGNKVSMAIGPGELLVVHYEFPKRQKTFSKEEMRNGQTISIPEAQSSLLLPPSDVDKRVTIKFKIHMVDKNLIKEYQEENPKEYADVEVLNGVEITSTEEIKKGIVEFQNDRQPPRNAVYFRFKTSGPGFNHWEYDQVKPTVEDDKLMFEMSLVDHTPRDSKKTYVVGVKKRNNYDRILDIFLTLLGFKANCKLLTLYKVPEEQDATINLRVFCIESKGFDLDNQADTFFEDKWVRIEEDDESSNFLITHGDVIRLGFKGKVGPREAKPPVITFIEKGSNSASVKLHRLDSNDPTGYVEMNLNDETIDSKVLDWNYLLEQWKNGTQCRRNKMDRRKRKGSFTCNLC